VIRKYRKKPVVIEALKYDGENPKSYYKTNGVSIEGVSKIEICLRILDQGTKIILSSGFGNPEKVKAFLEAEKELGVKLFDALGVGGVFPSRMATMDIIEVEGKEIHKVGRKPMSNNRLLEVI